MRGAPSFRSNYAEFLAQGAGAQGASQRSFVLKDDHEETLSKASSVEGGGSAQGSDAGVSSEATIAQEKGDSGTLTNSRVLKRAFIFGRHGKIGGGMLKRTLKREKKNLEKRDTALK